MFSSSSSKEPHPSWFWPVVVTVAIVVVASGWLVIPAQRTQRHLATCHENLRQVALALRQYAMDNDERFPPARLSAAADGRQPWGWADAIAPYTGGAEVFQCPGERTPAHPDPSQSGYTDYWYNANMGGVQEEKVAFLPSTVLIGEGNDGTEITSARYNKKAMPEAWMTDTTSPSFRHSLGANYAFVDGHIKWCAPRALAAPAPKYNTYSFGIR
jgi:prepilin-type processing-associated H-X9-DG protein